MGKNAGIYFFGLTALVAAGIGGRGLYAQQTSTPAPVPAKTAEEQFKNIQVLKNIPADQLIPAMQFITASLGVECEFCHVEHEMQKDDKRRRLRARKMITMMLAINRGEFQRGAGSVPATPAIAALRIQWRRQFLLPMLHRLFRMCITTGPMDSRHCPRPRRFWTNTYRPLAAQRH